jgi:predicted esterase
VTRPIVVLTLLPICCFARCSDDTDPAGDAGSRDAAIEADAAGDALGDRTVVDGAPDAWLDLSGVTCATPPPEGATRPAAPRPYSGGTCPQLVAGENLIVSGGTERRFLLVLPSEPLPDERLPVIFMWHWLAGSPEDFLEAGELQRGADTQRFIAVIPAGKGDLPLFPDLPFPWPFLERHSDERMEEEFRFFDDMLACVSEQLSINADCVSSVGISAGALFTAQLAAARSQYLSSFASLSGGIGSDSGGAGANRNVRRWHTPEHRLPAFMLWGGPEDICVLIDFELASQALEQHLTADGHLVVECVHNCGHAVPPVEAGDELSRYGVIWGFLLDHPFWLPPGQSPYRASGLPPSPMDWCAIGAGQATMRSGVCEGPGCPS